jgi:hypothetical protein
MSRELSGMPIKDVRKNVQQAVDFRLSDDQGRNKTEHMLSRRVDEQSTLQAVFDDCPRVYLDLHPLQQA